MKSFMRIFLLKGMIFLVTFGSLNISAEDVSINDNSYHQLLSPAILEKGVPFMNALKNFQPFEEPAITNEKLVKTLELSKELLDYVNDVSPSSQADAEISEPLKKIIKSLENLKNTLDVWSKSESLVQDLASGFLELLDEYPQEQHLNDALMDFFSDLLAIDMKMDLSLPVSDLPSYNSEKTITDSMKDGVKLVKSKDDSKTLKVKNKETKNGSVEGSDDKKKLPKGTKFRRDLKKIADMLKSIDVQTNASEIEKMLADSLEDSVSTSEKVRYTESEPQLSLLLTSKTLDDLRNALGMKVSIKEAIAFKEVVDRLDESRFTAKEIASLLFIEKKSLTDVGKMLGVSQRNINSVLRMVKLSVQEYLKDQA